MWEGYYQGADKNSWSQTQCSCSVSTLKWQIFALCVWQALDSVGSFEEAQPWTLAARRLLKADCKLKQTPQRATEVHTSLTSSATTISLFKPSNTCSPVSLSYAFTGRFPLMPWCLVNDDSQSTPIRNCSCHLVNLVKHYRRIKKQAWFAEWHKIAVCFRKTWRHRSLAISQEVHGCKWTNVIRFPLAACY